MRAYAVHIPNTNGQQWIEFFQENKIAMMKLDERR
jgi:hypothetical protein